MIRRRGERAEKEESSSDEEDAFSALGSKTKKQKIETQPVASRLSHSTAPSVAPQNADLPPPTLPFSITSSMKRHHKPNENRKAKMDALLQELEAEKPLHSSKKEPYRFVPDKKGSFADPSEENFTSNIFVGNLCPSITEEELRDLFTEFGPLYSVKIMWPRTEAERSRRRHTGFVCFMNRKDAEDAMDACNESDPFEVGRLLMMRWGKSVLQKHRSGKDLTVNDRNVSSDDRAHSHLDRSCRDPNEIPIDDDKSRGKATRRDNSSRGNYHREDAKLMTGRQIERAREARKIGSKDSKSRRETKDKLSVKEKEEFDMLVKRKLTPSRKAICSAMAYCFDKSAAAKEIAQLLKEVLLEDGPKICVDTRIARLYLLSDILFNSQQPGIRNAFVYRDALEKMAPEIFSSLGRHGGNSIGRMTMNKMKTAVSSVLGAWTEWSVYNPIFLDELEARFEGRDVGVEMPVEEEPAPQEPMTTEDENPVEVVINEARGGWTDVAEEQELSKSTQERAERKTLSEEGQESTGTKLHENKPASQKAERSIDRSPRSGDKDEEVSETQNTVSVDRESDLDGESLEDDDEIEPLGIMTVTRVGNLEKKLKLGDVDDEDLDGDEFSEIDEVY